MKAHWYTAVLLGSFQAQTVFILALRDDFDAPIIDVLDMLDVEVCQVGCGWWPARRLRGTLWRLRVQVGLHGYEVPLLTGHWLRGGRLGGRKCQCNRNDTKVQRGLIWQLSKDDAHKSNDKCTQRVAVMLMLLGNGWLKFFACGTTKIERARGKTTTFMRVLEFHLPLLALVFIGDPKFIRTITTKAWDKWTDAALCRTLRREHWNFFLEGWRALSDLFHCVKYIHFCFTPHLRPDQTANGVQAWPCMAWNLAKRPSNEAQPPPILATDGGLNFIILKRDVI